MEELPLALVGKPRDDLGEGGLGGTGERRIVPRADLAEAERQRQRLDLVAIEHLRRQRAILLRAIAIARSPSISAPAARRASMPR